jgi:SAM-dependent methyltransferase
MTQIRSQRKQAFLDHANNHATNRDGIVEKRFYYSSDRNHMRTIIRSDSRILDMGCGTGELLESLRPRTGVGVDMSSAMVEIAREKRPEYTFLVGDMEDENDLEQIEGEFDYILLSDSLAELDDCERTLSLLHRFCTNDTRLIVAHYSPLWQPVLNRAERLGFKTRQPSLNWFSSADVVALLDLADFEVISVDWRQLIPVSLFGVGRMVNRFIGTLPFLRRLCLRHYVVARSRLHRGLPDESALTIVIPCRNERDNVEPAIQRIPPRCDQQEILFVEGNSQDGTWEEIQRIRDLYPGRGIQAIRQRGIGKADAVWQAFDAARGDVLVILDGDLTVPPESLPRFYRAMVEGRGEFIMGTRMVYPVEKDAMRFLNYWANKLFAVVFSWLLRQRITDTLCGTKMLTRTSYERLKKEGNLGEDDPFGDFDLILGAARQNLKIVEIPIRYQPRAYGETQISRFRHGFMLARMVLRTYRQMQ